MSGRASLVADEGECESFRRSARAPARYSQTRWHIAAVMTPQVTA